MNVTITQDMVAWADKMSEAAVKKYPELTNDKTQKFTDEGRTRLDTQKIGFIGEAAFGQAMNLPMTDIEDFDRLHDFEYKGYKIDVKTTDRGGPLFLVNHAQFKRSDADIYFRVVLNQEWSKAEMIGWVYKWALKGPMQGKLSPQMFIQEDDLYTLEYLRQVRAEDIAYVKKVERILTIEDMM